MSYAENETHILRNFAENMRYNLRMVVYIHQRPGWPHFRWNTAALANELAAIRYRQGLLLGRMNSLGFETREQAVLDALSDDALKTSEIEGEHLDRAQVRSSIARRLGIEAVYIVPTSREVEGVVEMILDATRRFDAPLTAARLFGWHVALFPTGRSGLWPIRVGAWRDDQNGPMQVVSGPIGNERVHYEAPAAERLEGEVESFLSWFNGSDSLDPILKAAVAHLWFVLIHPFDDGNGRIGRAIADMALARSETSPNRFYSMSSQIMKERSSYYDVLAEVAHRDLDITAWIEWFIHCLDRAIREAELTVENVLANARFWDSVTDVALNERQRLVLGKLLGYFEGKLTSKKWAAIAKCSPDTALRDITDLIDKGILRTGQSGGRSTSYELVPLPQASYPAL